jgi:hypothetical protein
MEDVIEKARLLAEKYGVEPNVLEKEQIRIGASDPNGFSFLLGIAGLECIFSFGSWHQAFDNQEEALFAFEKCLSGEAQLRVVASLNIPYKGILEIYNGKAEQPEIQYGMVSIIALLLFLFPKKEKIYRNSFPQQIDQSLL